MEKVIRIWLKASGVSRCINESDFCPQIHSLEKPVKETKAPKKAKVSDETKKSDTDDESAEDLDKKKKDIESKPVSKASARKRVSKRVKADNN